MTELGTDEGSQGPIPKLSAPSSLQRGVSSRWGRRGLCQVIIRKAWPWTIVGNVLGEDHAHCTLKSFFEKCRRSYPTPQTNPVAVKSCRHCQPIASSFRYNFYIYCWICSNIKVKEQHFYCCSRYHRYIMVFNMNIAHTPLQCLQ